MNSQDRALLRDNLARVRGQIASAAERCGRRAEDVRLVAATKYVDLDVVQELIDAGCRDLGESRPQELWRKAAAAPVVRWHLIGHLQRNKVERTLGVAHLIHSLDSLRLAQALNAAAQSAGATPASVLLEINVSGDAAKHGLAPDSALRLGDDLRGLAGLQVQGLMCMAGAEADASAVRRQFRGLRELRDKLQGEWGPQWPLGQLSMGMSGDFEIAIEEGATLVRIGSALFEGIG